MLRAAVAMIGGMYGALAAALQQSARAEARSEWPSAFRGAEYVTFPPVETTRCTAWRSSRKSRETGMRIERSSNFRRMSPYISPLVELPAAEARGLLGEHRADAGRVYADALHAPFSALGEE